MLTRPRLTLRTLPNNLQKPFPELRGGMRPRLEADFRLCKRSVGRKVQRSAFLWLQCPNRSRAPNGSADAIEAQSFATEHFPNYGFSDVDPGEWFANDDILWYVLQHGLRA